MIFRQLFGMLLIAYAVALNDRERIPDEKFWHAVESWTEAICTVPSTKTITFHGVFNGKSSILKHFFDALLHGIGIYCEAVIVSKTYNIGNGSVSAKSVTKTENEPWKHRKSEEDTRRTLIWRSVFSTDRLLVLRKTKKIDQTNRKYPVDMWNINIIFIEDSRSFEEFLDFKASFEWTRREHFLVLAIWSEPFKRPRDRRVTIEKILKKLWRKNRIQNVFLNEPLSNEADRVMYSYNPFERINEAVWGKSEIIEIESKRHMFHLLSGLTYERSKDLHGYRLNISIFEQYQGMRKEVKKLKPTSIYNYSAGYKGKDGTILATIAKHMNFKVNIVLPMDNTKYGHQLENGTYTGALADVIYGRADVSFVSFFVKKYGTDTSVMEFTSQVEFDQVCVIVPKAPKIPKCFRIYHIFEPSVWIFILLSQIVMHIFWHYIQVFTPRRVKKVTWPASMYKAFLVNAGYPLKLPSSNPERILLVGVFLSSTTLMGTFNGILYQSFARDMHYKDIDRLKDLDESGLPVIFTSFSLTDVFGSEDDPDAPQYLINLKRKLVYGTDALETVAFHKNVSGLMKKDTYPLAREMFLGKDHSHQLHLVKECPGRYYLSYLLPRNSLLQKRLNVMIDQLGQAGLLIYWNRKILHKRARKMKLNISPNHYHGHDGFIPFRLSDVQTCFSLLTAGLILSSIVFCFEMGWFDKYCRKARRKKDDGQCVRF